MKDDALPTVSFTDTLKMHTPDILDSPQIDFSGALDPTLEQSLDRTHISQPAVVPPPMPVQQMQQMQQMQQFQHMQHLQQLQQQQIQPQDAVFPALPSQMESIPTNHSETMEKIIRDQELQDLKRRRKAIKISAMSNYNHLMTPSDKSYILRMQLSSLATADPYTDDFYAQIYSILMRKNQGVLNVGGMALSVAAGSNQSGMGAGAAKKLRDQIDKIVRSKREKQEDNTNKQSQEDYLVGALGKTSSKTNSRAPRQVLQVPSNESTKASAKDVLSSLEKGGFASSLLNGPQPALTRRQSLIASEKLYDYVLNLESLRRNQPQPIQPTEENPNPEQPYEEMSLWEQEFNFNVDELWKGLRVMEPLELSNPHPFISLIAITKTSKLLPRAIRHLDQQQVLTINTLMIACFSQYLRFNQDSNLVEAFLSGIVPQFMSMITGVSLRLVAGMLALFVERNDVVQVAQSKVCIWDILSEYQLISIAARISIPHYLIK